MNTESVKRYRRNHPDRVQAAKRKYNASPHGKQTAAAYNKRYAGVRKLLVDVYKAAPCTDCRHRYPSQVMEFDHRGTTQKLDHVSVLARTAKPSVILAEIAKCDLVCANCHRLRTISRQLDRDYS